MSTAKLKTRRIWTQLCYSIGGVLAVAAVVGAHYVYFCEYFRSGDSIRINLRYQQPVLLSSILVALVLCDILLATVGIVALVRWWRSREARIP